MKEKEKKKKVVYTYKYCRSIKREDGLQMKTVTGYTFRDFIDSISSRWPHREAYSVFHDPTNDLTFSQLEHYAKSTASYLIEHGWQKGDRLAIYGESCPNWMVFYLAATIIGVTAVPVLPDFSEVEVSNILRESKAKGIAVNEKTYLKVKNAVEENKITLFRLEDLVHIHEITGDFKYSNAPGFPTNHKKYTEKELDERKPSEDDVASLIFTSGTTGKSKGVVLTHKNILRNADLCTDVYVKLNPGDNVLSILPMSHVYEFTLAQCLTMMRGCHVTFLGKPPAVSVLMPAFQEIRPAVICSVPLLIEKVYRAAVMPVIKDNPKIRKLLKTPLKGYVYRTIGKKLYTTFGSRLKFFGVGGAALDPEVEKFLHAAHFPYAIGYGLTETSPLIAGCPPTHKGQKPGWIGKVVADDHVKLLNPNEEGIGEIAVKGVNVTKGYFNNPELNAESFTEDGYFKTGDLGKLDSHNRLAIRGRVKTMILGPAGENIYPESIESLLNNMSFVQESLVVPENGGLTALIKIDLKAYAEKMRIDMNSAWDEAVKYINTLKKEVNAQLSSYSKLDDVELQDKEFEKTPTQKIKRFLYTNRDKTNRGTPSSASNTTENRLEASENPAEKKESENIPNEAKDGKDKKDKADITNRKIEFKALKKAKKEEWKTEKRKRRNLFFKDKEAFKAESRKAKEQIKKEKAEMKRKYRK